ncbi:amino acid--tRNA ligase-related protein [Streptacidiphilus sp. EB129]|uniref:amino acid--tRNA ligase-related protein n=1 Tax=Streptacidiphilus sp. EB129 TaxID=3156262 RepID=UPI003513B09B
MSIVNEGTLVQDAEAGHPRYLKILDDPLYSTLVDLQDLVNYETAQFWRNRGVRALHLPVTTSSISSPMGLGSDSLPVQVDLFGIPTYLADSMQFLLEYGIRIASDGCYYLMPSFRGEETDPTHLAQFFHSEAEIPGGLDEVMDVSDAYLRHLAAAVVRDLAEPVAGFAGGIGHLTEFLDRPTARMTFDDAVAALDGAPEYFQFHDGWRTINRAGERRLMELYGPAVWLTHSDHLSVPFYQALDETGHKALNADLLIGPGEIIGCGERHVDAERARTALAAHAVPEEDYDWYLQMKQERPLRTAGFGMGVERFFMFVLQHDDIRDLQLLERANGRPAVP